MVVIDYETGSVIWTGEDCFKETLLEFFDERSEAIKANIEAVAINLSCKRS